MRNLLGAALLLGVCLPAVAQEPPPPMDEAHAAEVRELLRLTNAAGQGQQMIAAIAVPLKKMNPQVPEAVWTELLGEIRSEDLAALAVPVYAKYLSPDDVKGLIAFYRSPVGQRLLSVQPKILEESMEVGRQWGAECARRVIKRLQEKGYGKGNADATFAKGRRTRG